MNVCKAVSLKVKVNFIVNSYVQGTYRIKIVSVITHSECRTNLTKTIIATVAYTIIRHVDTDQTSFTELLIKPV